jgi:hypothetical protein
MCWRVVEMATAEAARSPRGRSTCSRIAYFIRISFARLDGVYYTCQQQKIVESVLFCLLRAMVTDISAMQQELLS